MHCIMRHKLIFSAVCALLITLIYEVSCDKSCPKPIEVRKQTIIQSNESIKNGARLIGKDIVDSARECYSLCCNDETCNVAVMHYKEKLNALRTPITEKYCFLFDCRYPSVCSYEYHHRYAIIDLGHRHGVSAVKEEKTVIKPHPITTSKAPTTTLPPKTTQPPATIAKIKETTTVKAIHPAKSKPFVNVPSRAKVPTSKKKDECKKVCVFSYDPLCGDDNQSYDNKCLFSIAKCKNPSLKISYTGACSECPPGVPVAMCSDDPCKLHTCPANMKAVCKANYCGGCNALYYDKNGGKVNCSDSGVAVSHVHNEQAVTVIATDYAETPDESLPPAKVQNKDPYYNSERRKWLPHNASAQGTVAPSPHSKMPIVVVVKSNEAVSLMSLPLLIALIICIILLIGVIYRVKCVTRGKAKKVPIDDGDYLINGMYL